MKPLRENLLFQFSIISFVVMASIGVIISLFLSQAIASQAIDHLVGEAKAIASDRLLNAITPADLKAPMTGERYRQFDEFVQEFIVLGWVAEVKLWAKDTTLIYANIPTAVGQKFPAKEELQEALRGEIATAIETPEELETEGERFLGSLMSVYVPILFPGSPEPQGAFEIYAYYEPTAQYINSLRRWTFSAVGVGLIGLYSALVYIFWRAWRTIRQQQAALLTADRLASIGELASGIAHELNNPLTSVIGFSALLLEKPLPEDIKKDLTLVNQEAQRTARIVRNLLTFARHQPMEKQPVDLNKTIRSVLDLRAYEQKVSNIEVITRFAPDLPQIMGNSFQLQQVFLNIIINAEYFMLESHGRGTLTITTERVGNFVRASLADDGPGIPKENLTRVFSPFFTTKEVGKGTGLGLSICHGIITEHGGKIWAESELGKGTTFVVELPISTIPSSNRK